MPAFFHGVACKAFRPAWRQLSKQGVTVSQDLISALQNPALYPHPVDAFRVIEDEDLVSRYRRKMSSILF